MLCLKIFRNSFQNQLVFINKFNVTTQRFAGHSKWQNIKHIKAEKDGQKAALFTRISRQLRLAVQEGGADPAVNSQLKSIVDEALRKNMPLSTIQNSIKKSQQSKEKLQRYLLEIRYRQKVFGICVLYTDNFPGLKMEIAPILKKNGIPQLNVRHLFDEFGLIQATADSSWITTNLEERATEDAIESGAEDVEVVNKETGELEFISSPIELNSVRQRLEKKGYKIENAEHGYQPKTTVQLSEDEHKAYEMFLNKLLDQPGVEEIYDNVERH